MEETTLKVREAAKEALLSGKVDQIIGFEKGDFHHESCPVFISDANAVDTLIWDAYCINNLSKYLIEALQKTNRIGIFLKGCDSRGFNQLVQDNRIDAKKVVVYGIPCSGMIDPKKGDKTHYEKCLACEHPNPVVFDHLLGSEVKAETNNKDALRKVHEIEAMTPDDKYDYWSEQFSKCVRCYACRNICPACNCVKCVFENSEVGVSGKAKVTSEDQFFHMTRAYHVAGRCVDCGECSRVCPEAIPLDLINRKIIKEITTLYGSYDAGLTSTGKATLVSYELEDIDPFERPKGGAK